MFKFLKEKLKNAFKKIEKKVESVEEKSKEEKKGFMTRVKEKITTKSISDKLFDEIFWDLEVILLENNVAVEVIDKIKIDLKKELVGKAIKRGDIEKLIKESLGKTIEGLFDSDKIDILKEVKKKKPYIIIFVGINGSGKTTTIAKIANYLIKNKLKCVLVAGDTWRQAAIEQLEVHADKLKVPIVKHQYGSDPAAIAFDGIAMAKARGIDVILIDTAGRMHSNTDLLREMQKIVRVANPDLKLFIGESTTGNDCVEQAKKFNETIDLNGLILTKADVDEKGGAAISISYVVKKPIIFLGVGQNYDDLEVFDKKKILKSLGL